MIEMKAFGAAVDKVERIEFEAIRKGLVRLDVTDRDGKVIFQLHRDSEVLCKRCKHVQKDPLANSCPKCGANKDLRNNPQPHLLVNRPLYNGPWGRQIQTWLKDTLGEIFRDGTLEWVPERDSWFFTPTNAPLDRKLAAQKVLDQLLK